MPTSFTDTPEEFVALRTSVEDWLEKATNAVWSFHRDDGLFWRDTVQFNSGQDTSSLTTTARSYMALACANRCSRGRKPFAPKEWPEKFSKLIEKERLDRNKTGKIIDLKTKGKKLNNFELSHIVDFVFVRDFFDRFTSSPGSKKLDMRLLKDSKDKELETLVADSLLRKLDEKTNGNIKDGQVFFDEKQDSSKHFFVTLHSLRALAILHEENRLKPDTIDSLTDNAARFCVEQCFYSTRGLHHLQDTARLAFAGVIYALYAAHVDQELCLAVVEALADTQLDSGNWPATHPIIRPKNDPWYIATHEIALCLTWLYFQPRVPDAARPVLLSMLERYFTKWVIPTYLRIPIGNASRDVVFEGWYDDRATGHNEVVGWATAIVCHFLANYLSVLNDHINRRVIESLDLQAYASGYLIAETQHSKSARWTKGFESGDYVKRRPKRATWPDVPPFAWPVPQKDTARLVDEFSWDWTDPTAGASLSKKLAEHVLVPIMDNPEMMPKGVPRGRQYAAGILDGPPGTRKTSFVRTTAKFMEWPLVLVPAAVIFERGFDLMEAQASKVFRCLNYLTQCVIFFDEFEEFFKNRIEKSLQPVCKNDGSETTNSIRTPTHNRTIAAFTTSAMLPRLQDLRDEGRCLIFLATNHIGKIDNAIVRPGRFDFKETIGHPKTQRFLAESESYFVRPTARTLKELDIAFVADTRTIKPGEKGQEKLDKIGDAVQTALKSETVKNVLQEYNTERKKNAGEEEAEADDIPFSFVEEAMRRVARRLPDSPDSAELAEEATTAIVDACKRAKDEKGPPGLPEVDDGG